MRWDAIDFQYKTITTKHMVCEAKIKLVSALPPQHGEEQKLLQDIAANRHDDGAAACQKREAGKVQKGLRNAAQPQLRQLHLRLRERRHHKAGMAPVVVQETPQGQRLANLRIHDLRHSCATLLRHKGVAMEDISKWLGHSNLLTTEQIYAHYDDSLKEGTLKTVSRALDKKKEMD